MSKNNSFKFEKQFYNNVVDILNESARTEIKPKFRESKSKSKSYSSISFSSGSAEIQIEEKLKVSSRFGVKPYCKNILTKLGIEFSEMKSSNYLYINISAPEDAFLYKELFYYIYDNVLLRESPDSFDCCSRYMQCSDNLECVNPHAEVSRYCRYKTKLKKNIVFYGKNRTIE